MEKYKAIKKELTKPFPVDAIQYRIEREVSFNGKKAYKVVPYLDTRYIIARLNHIVPGEWKFETEVFPISEKGVFYGFYAKSTLTICEVSHSDVGSTYLFEDPIEKIKKQSVKLDPKGAVTDSLRRVSALHGIGLYFWFLRKDLFIEDPKELREKSRKIVEYEKYILTVAEELHKGGFV